MTETEKAIFNNILNADQLIIDFIADLLDKRLPFKSKYNET